MSPSRLLFAMKNQATRGISGKSFDLLQALNAIAVHLQRSARSAETVYRIFEKEIGELGLRGGINLLDETGNHLILKAVAGSPRILSSLEKLTGLKIKDYQIPLKNLEVYEKVVYHQEAVYSSTSASIVASYLPAKIGSLLTPIMKKLGDTPIVAAPLVYETSVRGILNISGDGLIPEDVTAISVFANHIAVALENAALFAEMERTESKYRVLAESARESIFVVDKFHELEYINPFGARLMGSVPADLIGKALSSLFPGETYARMHANLERTRQSGEPITTERTFPFPGGERWLNTVLVPIRKEGREYGAVMGIAHDVTRQKTTEESLRTKESELAESLELYRRLMDTLPDAVTVSDMSGTITMASERAAQMAGVNSVQDLIGKSVMDSIDPRDRDLAALNTERTLKEGTIHDVEYLLRKSDGTPYWGEVSASVLLSSQGSPKGFVGSIRDVTERRRDRESIQQKSDDLNLINRMNRAVSEGQSLRRVLILFSRETEKVLGCQNVTAYLLDDTKTRLLVPQGIISVALAERIHRRFGLKIPDLEILLGKDSFYGEIIRSKKAQICNDAKTIHLMMREFTKNPVLKKMAPAVADFLGIHSVLSVPLLVEGQPIGMAGFSRPTAIEESDAARFAILAQQLAGIVHHKQVEDELRESEARYRHLIENATDGIVLLQDGKVVFANQRMKEMAGKGSPEIVGKPFLEFIAPEEVAKIRARYERRMAGDRVPSVYSSRAVRPDGSIVDIEINAGIVMHQGKPADLALVRDISERKQTERELLRAKEAAEEASNAKTEFLSAMSHELRTPLTSVLGFAELLQRKAGDSREISDYGEKIVRNSKHLLSLINGLLDLAKIETGRLKMNIETLDLNDLLPEVYSDLSLLIEEKGLEGKLELSPKLKPVAADRLLLKQAIINIFENAIKFTRSGSITLSARLVPRSRKWVELSVSDTGPGIQEERLLKIFERFQQAQSDSDSKPKGVGLGLAITKELVEKMGGRIEVQSRANHGSTFTLLLPRA